MIRLRPSGVDEILIKRVQDWYEPGPGVFITSTSTLFSPIDLFTTGVTGAWYDPSDITTLYRDAAGTQPVTAVEQPVGLMLDKSKGLVLGPELVTNGTFDTNINGWTTTVITPGGTATWFDRSGNGAARVSHSGNTTQFSIGVSVTAGRTYKLNATAFYVSGTLSGSIGFRSTGSASTSSSLASKPLNQNSDTGVQVHYTAVSTTTIYLSVYLYATTGVVDVDNISVRELPGNHAFNSSGNSANFPVLSARYNLLTKTEDFSDGVWSKFTAGGITITVTANAGIAPDGSTTADRVTSTGDASVLQNGGARVSGAVYTMSMWVKRAGSTNQTFRLGAGNGTSQDFSGNFTATNEWQRFSFNVTATGGGSGIYDGVTRDSSNNPYDILVWGADLRVANDALNQPAYQRVNTSTDYDTVGFKPYLKFNGNQWLQTNSIDFAYGDKMFVCAGVRKLSDAAAGVIVELAAAQSVTGSISLIAREYAAGDYALDLRGTSGYTWQNYSGFAAPITNVLTTQYDQSGTTIGQELSFRANGSPATLGGVSGGPNGNTVMANAPLYIGARAGSSLWLNGRLYQLVVAGKQASAAEITSTETYLNQKTGAF